MAPPALAARSLIKRYGAVQALAGLDLDVPAGGVFGLLGPNGAGKSTLLRIAIDLVRPSAGTVELFGAPPSPAVLRRVGSFIEAPRFHAYLSAREALIHVALVGGLRRFDPDPLLDRVGLTDAADRRVDTFSLGMKQRLGIAAALVGTPELVILDEPTNGMDPAGISEIRTLVRNLADLDGVTVLLSSHLLDEVQRICDRVAILDHGRLVATGAIGDMLATRARLRISATPADAVLATLGARGQRDGDAVLADIERSEAPALIAALVAAGVAIEEARWEGANLESLFFQQTGGGR